MDGRVITQLKSRKVKQLRHLQGNNVHVQTWFRRPRDVLQCLLSSAWLLDIFHHSTSKDSIQAEFSPIYRLLILCIWNSSLKLNKNQNSWRVFCLGDIPTLLFGEFIQTQSILLSLSTISLQLSFPPTISLLIPKDHILYLAWPHIISFPTTISLQLSLLIINYLFCFASW